MGNTTSQIKIIFDGSARGVVTAAGEARAAISGLDKDSDALSKGADKIGGAFLGASKGILTLGSAAGSLQTVAGAVGSLATASGILAAVPAVAVAGAAGLITYKLAVQGVGDAFGAALANDPAKYAESVGKLAPNARDAAGAVRELAPDLKALQQSVQDDFFYGFADTARQLGATYLPVLNRQLPSIALQMGQMATLSGKALMEPAVVESLNDTLGGTADLFDGLKTAPGDVLSGIILLAGAGSGELDGLGNSVGDIAADFKQWAAEAVETGRAQEWIANAKAELRDYGTVLGNVGSIGKTVWTGLSAGGLDFSASLVETTTRLDEFLKTAEGQDALRELGETLKVTGDVAREILLTAIEELAPVIVELAPAAREVATAVGDELVNAMRIAGPILQGVAGFLSEHKELLGDLVPLVIAAVTAYKGFQIAQQVAGWVGGATTALGLFGKGAEDAGKKTGGLTTKAGLLKGALGALVFAAAIDGLAELQRSTEGADGKISDFTDTLQDFSGAIGQVASGDVGGIFSDIAAEWDQMIRHLQGNNHFDFDVNTGPAQAQVTQFMNALKGTVGTVKIDGRTEDASQALADIVQAINAGRGEVLIDGKPTPVQTALDLVVAQINASGGLVEINGNYVPAGDALRAFLLKTTESKAVVPVTADTVPFEVATHDGIGAALVGLGTVAVPVGAETSAAVAAVNSVRDRVTGEQAVLSINGDPILATTALNGLLSAINSGQGTVTMNGQSVPATQVLAALMGNVNTSTGTVTINGKDTPAVTVLSALITAMNSSSGTATINGQDLPARSILAAYISQVNGSNASVKVGADTSAAQNALNAFVARASATSVQLQVSTAGRLATGGMPFGSYPGMAFAGPVYGPGTGTSDTAGLFRLSNGEHVLTAAEVRAAGGQAAVYRLRKMLLAGDLPGFAAGGARGGDGAVLGPLATPDLPALAVTVKIGDQELRGMIRTEVKASDRETARIVRAGAGTGY